MTLKTYSQILRRILAGPAVYTIAVFLSFLDTRISLAIYAVMPIFYILAAKIDIH